MNILKPEWFRRRKYSGWGLTPVTWQGWAFVVVLVAPLVLIAQNMTSDLSITRLPFILFAVYIALIVMVVFYIMTKIKMDEREKAHEAISDRNALWVMLFVLIMGILSETVSPQIVHSLFPINPFPVASILGAWLAKVATAIYLDKTD